MVYSVLQLSSSLVLKLLQTFKIELNLQQITVPYISYNLPFEIVLYAATDFSLLVKCIYKVSVMIRANKIVRQGYYKVLSTFSALKDTP